MNRMNRGRFVLMLRDRIAFVRSSPKSPLDAHRLDIALAELLATVTDMRSGDIEKSVEYAEALEKAHDDLLSIIGFQFLTHSPGCGCPSCGRELGDVSDPLLRRTAIRAVDLGKKGGAA